MPEDAQEALETARSQGVWYATFTHHYQGRWDKPRTTDYEFDLWRMTQKNPQSETVRDIRREWVEFSDSNDESEADGDWQGTWTNNTWDEWPANNAQAKDTGRTWHEKRSPDAPTATPDPVTAEPAAAPSQAPLPPPAPEAPIAAPPLKAAWARQHPITTTGPMVLIWKDMTEKEGEIVEQAFEKWLAVAHLNEEETSELKDLVIQTEDGELTIDLQSKWAIYYDEDGHRHELKVRRYAELSGMYTSL